MIFDGNTFCFTGKMKWTRKKLEQFVWSRGGSVSHKVTKSTDYLVEGSHDHASKKVSDARRLGVKVITAAEFFAA